MKNLLNDFSEIEYIGGCESGPCSGYYNPAATEDDGSCDYFQSPSYEQVVKPLYNSSINRHHNYRNEIQDIIPEVEKWINYFSYKKF